MHSVDGADSPIAAEIRQGQVADAPIVVQSDEVVVAFFSDQSLANNQQRAEDLDIASDADDQDAESEEAEDSAPVGEAAGLNSNSEGDAVNRQAAAAEREAAAAEREAAAAVERKRQAAAKPPKLPSASAKPPQLWSASANPRSSNLSISQLPMQQLDARFLSSRLAVQLPSVKPLKSPSPSTPDRIPRLSGVNKLLLPHAWKQPIAILRMQKL